MERRSDTPVGGPAPPRLTIRLAWAAGVLPFVLVVAVALGGRHRGPSPLRLLAEAQFPAPLQALESGTDRRGDHVALIDGQQRLHVLGLHGGRLTDQTLTLPWASGTNEGLWLAFSPSPHGELLDLRVNAIREDDCGAAETPSGQPPDSAVFSQGLAGFTYAGPGSDRTVATPRNAPAEVYDGDAAFRLRSLVAELPATQVIDRQGRVQLLRGEVIRAGDLTGHGRLELLAAERYDDEQFGVLYRLYSRRGDAFREVWQAGETHPRRRTDVSDNLRALAVMVDLDGDGRCDLLVGDSISGTVSVMRWAEPNEVSR